MEIRPILKGYFGPFCLFEVVCGRGCLSGLRRGVIIFGGLGLQVQTDVYSVSNILKVRSL